MFHNNNPQVFLFLWIFEKESGYMTYNSSSPIAVIDSGIGGITVLRKLYKLMPNENFIYFGDSANAPYGVKTKEEIKNLTVSAAERLMKRGAKAVVIACNTATSAAVSYLREKYPDFIFIGLEPAVKPAALSKENPRVLVLATPLTLKEEKFNKLVHSYRDKAEFISLPAPDLVKYIESGKLDTPAEISYLEEILEPYRDNKVDAVVLGCTHFPFARKSIIKILGDKVQVFDGGQGAAMHCKHCLEEKGLLNESVDEGTISFENSDSDKIEISIKMFNYRG